jgi:hypothetical protein
MLDGDARWLAGKPEAMGETAHRGGAGLPGQCMGHRQLPTRHRSTVRRVVSETLTAQSAMLIAAHSNRPAAYVANHPEVRAVL